MKRLLYVLFFALLAGCSLKEDAVFDQSPDERLDAKLKEYQNMLTSAPNGWLMTLSSSVSGGYQYWATFDDQNRVTMLSDADATYDFGVSTSTVPCQSSYRLKAAQTPTLMFDTYGYIHLLADPEGAVNGGLDGFGHKVDYEYSMIKSDNGQIYLNGNFFGSTATLRPATVAEAQAASKGALTAMHSKFENFIKQMSYPTITIGEKQYGIMIGARTTMIAYEDNGRLVQKKINTYLELDGAAPEAISSSVGMIAPETIGNNLFTGFKFNGTGYVAEVDGSQYEVHDNDVPFYALSYGLGKSFTAATFDYAKLKGTVKEPFYTDVYDAALKGLAKDGGRYIENFKLTFMISATTMKPVLRLYMLVRNPASPASQYYATWYYDYTDNGDGTITFTDRNQSGSSNEFRYEPGVMPLLDYLCGVTYTKYDTKATWADCVKNVVTPKTFRFDWVKSETVGLKDYLVGYIPTASGQENNVLVGILSDK